MTTNTPIVVVGVDGSEHATRAARAAAAEAARRGWPLRLVRAFSWTDDPMPGLPDTLASRAAARRSVNADLDRLCHELDAASPGRSVGATLVEGHPGTALCRAVTSVDLLVVGAGGTTWSSAAVLGSVAESVAAAAPCPVLVHRPLPAPASGRHGVVVGAGGDSGTAAVLGAAAREAEDRHVPLTVVHAWRQLTTDETSELRWRLDRGRTADVERDAVEPAVADVRRHHPGLQVTLTVVAGRAGRVLVHRAREAELVVVGRRGLAEGGPGATVHSVLHQADVPVLVVPVPAVVDRPAAEPVVSAGAGRPHADARR
jgi:nucleotide-binding universal stress UspA family protein